MSLPATYWGLERVAKIILVMFVVFDFRPVKLVTAASDGQSGGTFRHVDRRAMAVCPASEEQRAQVEVEEGIHTFNESKTQMVWSHKCTPAQSV